MSISICDAFAINDGQFDRIGEFDFVLKIDGINIRFS